MAYDKCILHILYVLCITQTQPGRYAGRRSAPQSHGCQSAVRALCTIYALAAAGTTGRISVSIPPQRRVCFQDAHGSKRSKENQDEVTAVACIRGRPHYIRTTMSHRLTTPLLTDVLTS
eukprot:scaffold16087_cov112-Isochrysis_galbana.AAC.6